MKKDIRAEFEAWYDKETNRNDGVAYYVDITGKYCFADIEFAWRAYKAATEAARGGVKSGVWQFFQNGEWHVGMNQLNHRANTEAEGYPVRDLYIHTPATVVPDRIPQTSECTPKPYASGWNDCIAVMLNY